MSMRGDKKPTLYVYNWGDYIDEDVIDRFEKEYDVRVVYDTFQPMKICMLRLRQAAVSTTCCFQRLYD